jgi:hypothetical protein
MAGYIVLLSWDALAFARSPRRERTRRRLIDRALRAWRGMLRPPRLGVA